MITCPLCNIEVKDPIDQKPVENDHANNFYCPNYITFSEFSKKICHFSRKQLRHLVDGATAYSYQAITAPFQITWATGGKVTVHKLDSSGNREGDQVYQSKNVGSYNTFIKTCQRFKVLVPFS